MKLFILLEIDLVLIGGGYSYAIVFWKFVMNFMFGVRLILIMDVYYIFYFGMLLGYVVGLYNFD